MSRLYVLLVALLPVVELRGAIPLGVALGLPPGEVFFWALLGNLLIAPLALALIPWLLRLAEAWPPFGRLWAPLEARVRLKGEERVQRLGALGLFLFVALPVPGTGAWSGSLLAVVLGLKRRYALLAISLGVLAAGVLVLLLTGGVVAGLDYLR